MGIIKDYVIPIIVGAFAIVAVLITPSSFLVHPDFQIQVTKLENSIEKVDIINNGLVQAKNVRISVISDAILNTHQTDCPEGIQEIKDQNNVLDFQMDRMSRQLSCDILVKSNGNVINKVVVTALDSPAYQWRQEIKTTQILSYQIDYIQTIFTSVIVGMIMYAVARAFIRSYVK